MNDLGLLILRITVSWMFLYPLKLFYMNFTEAKQVASLVNHKHKSSLAILMLSSMLFGGLFILLGIFVREASIVLSVFSLVGIYAHKKLAKISIDIIGPQELKNLAFGGHTSSAWKNVPILGILSYLVIVGGGQLCL